MSIVGPSSAELAEIAADLGFHFDAADVAAFRELMRGALDAYSALDRLPDALPVPRHPRLPGGVPSAEDNPFGAFARTVEITGEPNGPLTGKRVVIKDCVCVAGVPMMNGSSTFEGYVPEIASSPARTGSTAVKLIAKSIATPAISALAQRVCVSGFWTRRSVCRNRIRVPMPRCVTPWPPSLDLARK
jgi:amidase